LEIPVGSEFVFPCSWVVGSWNIEPEYTTYILAAFKELDCKGEHNKQSPQVRESPM
jgi:hypothetical protein